MLRKLLTLYEMGGRWTMSTASGRLSGSGCLPNSFVGRVDEEAMLVLLCQERRNYMAVSARAWPSCQGIWV